MEKTPKDLRYSKDHEWIRIEGENIGICGITYHAQELLTDVVFVELPKIGQDVAVGERVAVVESVKAVSDIYSPVSGRIIEVNTALEETPELINKEPYGKGWVFKIGMEDTGELGALMDAAAYNTHVTTGA